MPLIDSFRSFFTDQSVNFTLRSHRIQDMQNAVLLFHFEENIFVLSVSRPFGSNLRALLPYDRCISFFHCHKDFRIETLESQGLGAILCVRFHDDDI